MKAPVITRHAQRRARERLGFGHDAVERLVEGFHASVKVPPRIFAHAVGWRPRRKRKGDASYRLSGRVVYVCRGRRVVTVYPLCDEVWGSLMVWMLTGQLA